MLPLSGGLWQFDGATAGQSLPVVDSGEFKAANWTSVTVPNDFQTRTDMSITQGWYRRNITVTPDLARKQLYLVFEGAAAITDVYVNGQLLGEHRGAFTRFIFDATSALHVGDDNELAVKVDNRPESTTDCLPSHNGLYTVWGGLYRNVWLLATNYLQIDPTYYASPGVFITPTMISSNSAKLDIKVLLRNTSNTTVPADVKATVLDPNGAFVTALTAHDDVFANQQNSVQLSGTVSNPELWSPASPNLYHVRVDIEQAGVVSDSLVQPLGFHSLSWDFTNGLVTLNGAPYTLYGVDLHQEIERSQSAVQPEDLTANFDAMKDLGVNFVRLAHYPRAQLEYDQCDERGLFCWAENGHSHDDLPSPTADLITTEMVEQNYNHPSIIVWSVGNEGNAAPSEREVPVVKALDQSRPVFVANMHCANADYIARNTYPGWYGGGRWSFKPSGLISEVGAGGAVTSHCDYADAKHTVDSYEPEEYQQLVAETEFEQAFRHNDGGLGMFTWWAMREFNDTKYKSKLAPFHHGINTKGLETYAGFKKDVYYLYRCFLRPDTPTIHIASKLYFLRQGAVDNGIKVYSNADSVTLKVNGTVASTQQNGAYSQDDPLYTTGKQEIDNVFYWPVPLHIGRNTIEATDGHGNSDSAVIYYYGASGLPELPDTSHLVTNVTSSNPNNPAYYINMPVHEQWPIYYDFDSTADNSLDSIPAPVTGATWLALHRVTKDGEATNVGFTTAAPVTVYVICTKEAAPPATLTGSAFTRDAVPPFKWRGNDLILVDAELYSKHLPAGQTLNISLGDRDALVLFKRD